MLTCRGGTKGVCKQIILVAFVYDSWLCSVTCGLATGWPGFPFQWRPDSSAYVIWLLDHPGTGHVSEARVIFWLSKPTRFTPLVRASDSRGSVVQAVWIFGVSLPVLLVNLSSQNLPWLTVTDILGTFHWTNEIDKKTT